TAPARGGGAHARQRFALCWRMGSSGAATAARTQIGRTTMTTDETRGGLGLRWQWLILLLVLGGFLYLLAPVLTPFAIAALFAYLCDPLVDRLEARGMGRGLGTSIVFLIG